MSRNYSSGTGPFHVGITAPVQGHFILDKTLQYQDTIWSEHSLYLRTQSRDLPSEKTVKQILAPLFLKQFFRLEENGMIQQIRARLMAVSDEIDDD